MAFIVVTAIITLFCLYGLIRTAKEKNLFGAGFAFTSFAVFGWFSLMSALEFIREISAK